MQQMYKTIVPANAPFIKTQNATIYIQNIFSYMAPICFGPFGPSSGSIRRNLAKVSLFKIIS